MKTNKEEFIEKAKKVHCNENLDFSEVVYINNRTKVKIIDRDLDENGIEYGVFYITPSNLLKGRSHPKKRGVKISKKKRSKQEEIISKFKTIHAGENLDYSQVVYRNMHTKVKIISHELREDGTEYGEFWQEPAVHLKGCTHPDIGRDKRKKIQLPIIEYQTIDSEIANEEIYDYIKSTIGDVCKDEDFGIYVPSKHIGFEFNGIRWHSEKYNKDRYYHLNKRKLAKEKGVTLIHIFEDEYLGAKNIVLDKIGTILGVKQFDKKIPARKCNVKPIDFETAKSFLETNHIQGFCKSTVHLGCYYGEELIAVMSFLNEGKLWNLTRFATKNNYLCQGVASKIFTYFTRNYKPNKIKSFLDLRWCFNENENLYTKLGFVKEHVLKPDYRYTNGFGKRKHKFGFRKETLHKKYGFPLTMTESEMTEKLGYYKIWDCGLIRYVWTPS